MDLVLTSSRNNSPDHIASSLQPGLQTVKAIRDGEATLSDIQWTKQEQRVYLRKEAAESQVEPLWHRTVVTFLCFREGTDAK